MNVSRDVSPVNCECPEDRCQQNLISFKGKGAPMKKERKMRTDHDSEPLREVPVPRMRAVEISHTVENVKLQEVELDQSPLKKPRDRLLDLSL